MFGMVIVSSMVDQQVKSFVCFSTAVLLLRVAASCPFNQQQGTPSPPPYLYPPSSPYLQSCPAVERIVLQVMQQALQKDPRLPASILRLHFHDCFVNGCDGSILLDDTPTLKGEKSAGANNNSIRGYEVIDDIKSQLEIICPGVVSCADVVAIAARDSVVLNGGPSWDVVLGRKDSRTANFDEANKNMPSPLSDVDTLVSKFQAKELTAEDMVALSGAHTIGFTRCSLLSLVEFNRGGNGDGDSAINSSFLQDLQGRCGGGSGNTVSPLDYVSAFRFDNYYFSNLKENKGVFRSDRVLASASASTRSTVELFASNQFLFFESFKCAMIKMGNISPPKGIPLEIRRNCRKVN